MKAIIVLVIIVFCCVIHTHCGLLTGQSCLDPYREEFLSCGCERTCRDAAPQCSRCHAGCYCRNGWIRNDTRICVVGIIQCEKFHPTPRNPCLPNYPTESPCYTPNPPCSTTSTQAPTAQPCGKSTTSAITENPCPTLPTSTEQSSSPNPCQTTPSTDQPVEPTKPAPKCPKPFEEYQTCKCEKFCDNLQGINCNPDECIPGCVCKHGFFRNYLGGCSHSSTCFIEATNCLKPFEEYQFCKCERTCYNLQGINCDPTKCIPGCVCELGFVRNSSGGGCSHYGSCFTKQASTCSNSNEEYVTHKCERTCQDLSGTTCDFDQCKPGCICKFGFVRDASGGCSHIASCFQKPEAYSCSSLFEEHQICKCDRTCRDIQGQNCYPTICTAGCVCKLGFVRSFSGQCIHLSACYQMPQVPSCSNTFEEYQFCKCERTCEDYYGNRKNAVCTPGCVCKLGLVRDSSGGCSHIDTCFIPKPSVCSSPLEEYQHCKCERTCENQHGNRNNAVCIPGCVCKPGFVRDSSGRCMHVDTCFTTKPIDCMKPEETYEKCCCERTCEDKTGQKCDKSTCENKCVCRDGFVRNVHGNCGPIVSCFWQSHIGHSTKTVSSSISHTKTVSHRKIFSNGTVIKCNGFRCSGPLPANNTPDIFHTLSEILKRNQMNQNPFQPESTDVAKLVVGNKSVVQCNRQNEEFNSCGCDGVCNRSRTCNGCAAGCFCKSGFLRNSANICIRITDCSPL